MARQFVEVLLDGSSILDNIVDFRIERRRNQAVDTITLRLADFSLYSLFDFSLTPTTERLHVGTNGDSPTPRLGDVGAADITDVSEDFVAEGVEVDDIVLILTAATNPALIQGWRVTSVATTILGLDNLGSPFTPTVGVEYVILKNQGKFFVEKPDVIEGEEDIAIPSLWGRCGLARLTDPFVNRLTRTFTRKINFSEILAELVDEAGMDSSAITIDIDDFVVPGNLLTISNQLPLEIITNLARKTNGYVRCDKKGNLHIKKDFYHFAGITPAESLGDDEVRDMTERTDYPEFGNRVLVRSVTPEAAQDVRINLRVDTPCTRGDGRTPVPARAVVTTQRGLPVPNGTIVDWSITADVDTPIVFTTASTRTVTLEETQVGETKRSSSLTEVPTDFPIRDVIGVYLKMDTRKLTNFFENGGTFQGSTIVLGRELPFSNTLVVVDYVAAGIAKNTIRSIAGVPEGTINFVNAAVGRIRDSVTLCINNNRNVNLSLTAEPSEFNVCLAGSQSGFVTAAVRDNGEDGQLLAILWSLEGPGSLTEQFSFVRNTLIDEFQTSENLFTVNTRHPIASVVGVFVAEEGLTGTNHFTNSQQRVGSFADQKIILGTNLPTNRTRVIIQYNARSLARVGYIAPTGQTGPSVAFVTATIQDGTEIGIVETEQILLDFNCADEDGNIPGVDPNTNLPTERKQKEPDCDRSTAVSQACNIGSPDLNTFTECVCQFLSGSECPETEEECRQLCEADYQANGGKSSFLCDQSGPQEFCKAETKNASLALLQECLDQHKPATVEKCIERCLNHDEDSDLTITPLEAVIDCGGQQAVEFTVTGGGPPYTWTTTKGQLEVSETTFSAVLSPPATDPSVGGNAYRLTYQFEKRCGPPFSGFCCCTAQRRTFFCDDSPAGGCTGGGEGIASTCICTDSDCGADVSCGKDGAFQPAGCVGFGTCPNFGEVDCSQNCEQTIQSIYTCVVDLRTGGMIVAGCNPCIISMAGGAVVTVTDQFGKSAMATITNGQLVET